MSVEARFWQQAGYMKTQCRLCPHRCKLAPNEKGKCGVRINEDGVLRSLIYGMCAAVSEDPIEKKPLFHVYPGSKVLSVGTVGCNLFCQHCQNWSLSRGDPELGRFNRMMPDSVVRIAKASGCRGVAFTYNEPTVWMEFVIDTLRLAKDAGLYTSVVSNGYVESKPWEELCCFLDAANIDVKAFSDCFYHEVCGGHLQPVLETISIAHKKDVHVELTYLIIPGKNDNTEELEKFCFWVKNELGVDVPIHFTAFHPDGKMRDVPPTPLGKLKKAADIARNTGLHYVYIGNVLESGSEDTICPNCGSILIERHGYKTIVHQLVDSRCGKCGFNIPLLGAQTL